VIADLPTSVCHQGGLAGATADGAFSRQVGLGATMTQEDMLAGRLRVLVLVAIVWPAEFIGIDFEQQLEKHWMSCFDRPFSRMRE